MSGVGNKHQQNTGQKSLWVGRPECRWEGDTKIDLKQIGYEGKDQMPRTHDNF